MRLRIEDLERDLKKARKKEKRLTLIGHLSELRKRLIYCAMFFLLGAGLCYYYIDEIVTDLIHQAPDMKFVAIAPEELIIAYLRIAFLGGIIVAAPLIIMQIWLFVKPGLVKRERRYLLLSLMVGSLFFLTGIAFSYLMIIPLSLKFLASFQTEQITSFISFSNYLGFITNMLVSFGLVFELPILMLLLSAFGILKVKMVTKYRKHILIVILILAAFLTPPDVVSQLLLAMPMLLLFEIGIVFARMAEKARFKRLNKA
jgi:sec-independent protein translocase protein TatC